MSVQVTFSNPYNSITLQKDIPASKFAELKNKRAFLESKIGVASIFRAMLAPLRVEKEFFLKDLVAPTTTQQAMRVKDFTLKVFAVLISLPLDILTFPIRATFGLVGVLANQLCGPHPLKKYLMDEGVDKGLFKNEELIASWSETSTDGKINKIEKKLLLTHKMRPASNGLEMLFGDHLVIIIF